MATTLSIEEAAPTSQPAIPGASADVSVALVWRRIESYVAHRWSPRDVVVIAEGPGDWRPPLKPFVSTTVEIWRDGAWSVSEAALSPLGGLNFAEAGTYRISGVAGADNSPPSDVVEAASRLACFFAEARSSVSGAFAQSESIEGLGSFTYAPPTAVARAIVYSGAADLLRPYRELGGR